MANNAMNANEEIKSGWWYIISENRPSNTPYIGNGMFISLYSSDVRLQMAFDKNTEKGFWRLYYSSWSEWIEF